MAITTTKSAYRKGIVDALPFVLVIIPFASLFGLLATEAGLNVFETLTFSIVVIAGAAQFTALQLLQEDVPTAIILASALAVNLRMAMYSASLTPWIGGAPLWQRALAAYMTVDQSYVAAMTQYERDPEMTVPQRMAYFFGTVTPVVPLWYIFTLIGAMVGSSVPDSWALDFAIPITFLAMIAPMLRTPAHLAACGVAIVLALVFAGLPSGLGLMIAALAGMATGALVETVMERGKATQG